MVKILQELGEATPHGVYCHCLLARLRRSSVGHELRRLETAHGELMCLLVEARHQGIAHVHVRKILSVGLLLVATKAKGGQIRWLAQASEAPRDSVVHLEPVV